MPGTHLLPPNLLKLFAPRAPLPYARPVDKDIDRVTKKNVSGVAEILARLQEASTEGLINGTAETEGMEEGEEPNYTYAEETKRQIRREERRKKRADAFKISKDTYKPADDPEAIGDPYKTLFIARLNKNATETDVRREFETYGTIERVRVVRDKKGRSRGFAFIVYERERDMKAAYKESDGLYIMGKRILVDVERGRTVRGWKPRRLGGGLGGRPKPTEPPVFARSTGGSGSGSGGGGGGGGGPSLRGSFGGGGRGGFGERSGGFRGGRGGFGGGRGGGFGGGGDRGGYGPGPDRGYGDRGYGDRPGGGGGGFRGGAGGGGGAGGFRGREDYDAPPGGGYRAGRGGGLGYGGGGFSDGHPQGNSIPGGPPSGYGAPPPGYGGGGPGYGPPAGYGGGGYRGDLKRDGPGYDDRDSGPKRPRY